MRCCALDATAGGGDKTFDSCGVQSSSKFFFIRLDSRDDGNREQLDINTPIEFQNFEDFSVGLWLCEEGSVTFLP